MFSPNTYNFLKLITYRLIHMQMYSMRYGTVPVVRKTGGLADTVFDMDQKHIPAEKRNGFTFVEPTEAVSDTYSCKLYLFLSF